MSELVDYLVNNGVVSRSGSVVPGTPAEVLIERYRCYVVEQRTMVAQSVRNLNRGGPRLFTITGGTRSTGFDDGRGDALRVGGVPTLQGRFPQGDDHKVAVVAAFFVLEGLTANPLAGAVPSVASWRLASLPKALPAAQIASLVKSCDRRKTVGRRDFAVMALLSRLGLRAGEIAGLQLGDLDWRAGGEVVARAV